MSLPPSRPLAGIFDQECPVTPDSKECRKMKRQAAIEENRKRTRSVLDEVPGAEDVPRPEDMMTCRHAGMTIASFTPAQHLYMCCGRPIVVHLLMSLSPPPPFLITSWFDASKIWGIRFYTLPPWGLVALLTHVFHRCSS